ncbi:hypothetical protein ZYGR_0U00340 [Zygosaccharomyces rouxii]|uniref:BRO1 domain-containing protein n=1 Tax=Zygosaccharomyces rouxii TaxID=4956 RepID=A0A1Q3A3C0_ZYGRO|nr:hypothetical protein ZYGR_0U00340 [Zygosaccharomyces rouxii]
MTDLLCIPQKRTTDARLKDQLANAIESTSYQTASFFDAELNKIAYLRESISDPEPSKTKLRDLQEYLLCLEEISKKFPNDQIQFTWSNPLLQKSDGTSEYSLKFERLNIFYNIGSQYSILALESNDGSSQALKTMCLYFQYSAGCFQYIIRHLNDCEEPVFDLNSGHALVNIMLAQAQECFWFKAIQDGHKDSLIAKLAKQVSEYYEESLKFGRKSQLIRNDWCLHLESKANYFTAVTYFRNGLSLGGKRNYGAQIKSLEMALEYLRKSDLPSRADFSVKIEESLKEIQRDNDFIYLQTVPSYIDPVKPAPMVNASPVEAFIPKDSTPIFKDLLPIGVLDACSAYNERQEEYVKQYVVNPLLSLNKLLYESLPKFELPPNLKNISEHELESYELSLNDLKFNSNNIEVQISDIDQILRQESETDSNLRLKYGTINWDSVPSANVNTAYYEKLQKLREYLNQGRKVDEETFSLFRVIDKKLITSPIKFPESNSPLVKQVGNVTRSREKYAKEVESKSTEHRLLPRIISEYKRTGETEFEALFLDHLKFFDIDIKYVQHQREENKRLLNQLQSQEDDSGTKRLDPAALYVEDLQYSLKLLEDVKRNLGDGANFYRSLHKSANELLYEVQKFENARSLERSSMESKLNSH